MLKINVRLLKFVKLLLNIPPILIICRIFALSFRWRTEPETLRPRAEGRAVRTRRLSTRVVVASYSILVLTLSTSRPSQMLRYSEIFRPYPSVIYRVTLDNVKVFDSSDYIVCMAAVTAWRKKNPRENRKRMAIHIVV